MNLKKAALFLALIVRLCPRFLTLQLARAISWSARSSIVPPATFFCM